jgi:hypothetical protein
LAFTSTEGLGDGLGDALVGATDGALLGVDDPPQAVAVPATDRKMNAAMNRRINVCSSRG